MAKKEAGTAGTVKVRVLVAGEYAGKRADGNAVIELSVEDAKLHAGAVDADPAAVAYAESLKA
jgi:hypothetical protein